MGRDYNVEYFNGPSYYKKNREGSLEGVNVELTKYTTVDRDGLLHSYRGKPALLIGNADHVLKAEWYKHGKLHRGRGVASRERVLIKDPVKRSTHEVTTEKWAKDGKVHKMIETIFNMNPSVYEPIMIKNFFFDGKNQTSVDDKPVQKIYMVTKREFGKIKTRLYKQVWMVKGKKKRSGGKPAVVRNKKLSKILGKPEKEYYN